MKNRIRIAKKILKIARELLAVPTATYEDFENFSNEYQKRYKAPADSSLWDLFKSQDEVDAFLAEKKRKHPRLSEVLSAETIKRLLTESYFVICSAGISSEEYSVLEKKYTNPEGRFDEDGYEKEKNALVKERLGELRKFIDSMDCPYYEILGQFYDQDAQKELSELSFIIDLTDAGQNSDSEAKAKMRKITSFCGEDMNQTATIEGIGKQSAYVYCKGRSNLLSRGRNDDDVKLTHGRSTVRTDKDDPKSMYSWSDDYDWDADPNQKDWI